MKKIKLEINPANMNRYALEAEVIKLRIERNNWIETARMHCKNQMYYRGLLEQIGKTFGEEAYISDDGSVQDEVLIAKVPELVASILELSSNINSNSLCNNKNDIYYLTVEDFKILIEDFPEAEYLSSFSNTISLFNKKVEHIGTIFLVYNLKSNRLKKGL